MSIRYKIALLFAALVTVILTIVSFSIYIFSVKERQKTFRTRIRNRALSTAQVYVSFKDNPYPILRGMDTSTVASLYYKSITIVGSNDAHEYMYSNQPGDSLYLTRQIIDRTKANKEYFFDYNDKNAIAIYHTDRDANFIIAVGASDIEGREFLQQLERILLIAMIAAVVLAFVAGLIFARRLIRPISIITREVNLISSNNLSLRIKINEAGDELTRLAQTFNGLLDRLEEAFTIQRRFISNASHELSTPLTSVSSQLEVALQKDRSSAEYKEVMASMYEDIRELQQLTRSLLDIAKTGSKGGIDLAEVRLDEILFKVLSDVQRQNEGFRTVLELKVFPEDEKLLTVFGNGNLLYIALKNIIENGCKYSDDLKSTISAQFDDLAITVKVKNQGDVIDESDMKSIFQPFFRTQSAQVKPGSGLGLTLSKRIWALHNGALNVESNPETGTVFTLTIPNICSRH